MKEKIRSQLPGRDTLKGIRLPQEMKERSQLPGREALKGKKEKMFKYFHRHFSNVHATEEDFLHRI